MQLLPPSLGVQFVVLLHFVGGALTLHADKAPSQAFDHECMMGCRYFKFSQIATYGFVTMLLTGRETSCECRRVADIYKQMF